MEELLIGMVGGIVCGALSGFLLSLFMWWGQDLRDARLRAAGMPLPSDRVFPAYHWPFAGLGVLHMIFLAYLLDIPPLWAALSIFVIPALFLPVLVFLALLTWIRLNSSH